MDIEHDLNRIADAMQCPLHYRDGAINGTATFDYQPLPGLTLPVTVAAKKVSHNQQTSVLFKVSGHLWALVGFFAKTHALTMFLIDSTKCDVEGVMLAPDKFLSKLNTLKQSVDALRPAIVSSSVWEGTHWKSFKLPKK